MSHASLTQGSSEHQESQRHHLLETKPPGGPFTKVPPDDDSRQEMGRDGIKLFKSWRMSTNPHSTAGRALLLSIPISISHPPLSIYIPRRVVPSHIIAMIRTPPRPLPRLRIDEVTETPAPARARVNNLQNQVSELVRKDHAATVSRQGAFALMHCIILPHLASYHITFATSLSGRKLR